MRAERRKPVTAATSAGQPRKRKERAGVAKSFVIHKMEVWEAYQQVKSNAGGAGIDEQSIADFEKDLQNNLYKIWNRMASGSYMPSAVKRIEIPKRDGGKRPLGIPTVADRIAQTVVKRRIEPLIDPIFHDDSYGYRPGRSAHDALAQTRQRCWVRDWVLDVDIKGFFDNLDHGLLMKAVRKHVSEAWAVLYIERWLKADVVLPDGTRLAVQKGTPQGGVISPLLANLFLHYAFDAWAARTMPNMWFERYADDIVCHCNSHKQALWLRNRLRERLAECGLELHPQKTKIVYCRDAERTQDHAAIKFEFLGFEFRPRSVQTKDGRMRLGFVPAISPQSAKSIRSKLKDWCFSRHTHWTIERVADYWNPILRGWMQYYSRFYRSKLHKVLTHFDRRIAIWLARKHDRHRRSGWVLSRLAAMKLRNRDLFAHWAWTDRCNDQAETRAV
jgi:RNA-directed DNA polymerase